MIITCENCATGFNLAEKMLNPTGSKVRCSKCGHIFTAYPSSAPPPPDPDPLDSPPIGRGLDPPQQNFTEEFQPPPPSDIPQADPPPPVADNLADDDLDDLDALLDDLELSLEGKATGEDIAPQKAVVDNNLEDIDNLLDMDEESLNELLDIPGLASQEPVQAGGSTEQSADGDALDFELDDLDNILDEENDALLAEAESTAVKDDEGNAVGDEFDFSDLESLLDDETLDVESAAETDTEPDSVVSPLDEVAQDSSPPITADTIALESEADNDLSDEFDFSDLESLLEDTPDENTDAETLEQADLADTLDLGLDSEAVEESAESIVDLSGEASEDASDEFDFSDLESFLEEEGDETASPQDISDDTEAAEAISAVDLGPDSLSLDMDESKGADDDFDLGDLEELLSDDSAPVEPEMAEAPEAHSESDLDLDDDLSAALDGLGLDSAEPESLDATDLGIEDSEPEDMDLGELDLDAIVDDNLTMDDSIIEEPADEYDTAPMDEAESLDTAASENDEALTLEETSSSIEDQAQPAPSADEDFDLGELETVLDMDELTADAETAGPGGLGISDEHQRDLDELEKLLEIDDEDDSDDLSAVIEEQEADNEDLELDLAEIEKTLEAERQKAKAAELESGFNDDQIDLGSLEEAGEDESLTMDDDLTLELETSEEGSTPPATPMGDFQIEVEQDEPAPEMVEIETETAIETPFAMGDPDTIDTSTQAVIEEEPEPEPIAAAPVPPPMAPLPVKGRSRMPLMLLVLLVILVGAVLVLDRIGIQVPYVHEALKNVPGINTLLTPDIPDAGNLKLAARVADSRFVENSKSGRLFVIKGNISNEYKKPRTKITITGKLFGAGTQPVQTKTVVGGNALSDIDLANLPITELQTSLNQPAAAIVAPGSTLPFMIVFANLPDNLREYTVEVTGSSPAN